MTQLAHGYSLRLATPQDDAVELYKLMQEAAKATEYEEEFIEDHDGQLHVQQFLSNDTKTHLGLLLVSPEDRIVGVLAAHKHFHPPFMYPIASEIVWWVEPEHRKGMVPLEMLKAYEYWAKLVGCKYVAIGFMRKFKEGKEDQMKKVFLEMNYFLQEETYVKEIG